MWLEHQYHAIWSRAIRTGFSRAGKLSLSARILFSHSSEAVLYSATGHVVFSRVAVTQNRVFSCLCVGMLLAEQPREPSHEQGSAPPDEDQQHSAASSASATTSQGTMRRAV